MHIVHKALHTACHIQQKTRVTVGNRLALAGEFKGAEPAYAYFFV